MNSVFYLKKLKYFWLMIFLVTVIHKEALGADKESSTLSLKGLILTSPAFKNNQKIPAKYSCEEIDINPPLEISGIPKEAKSLALIMEDPDAPVGTWVHWVVYNIPPTTTKIKENSVPGQQGKNNFDRLRYGGPCPPLGQHRYFFKLYALDTLLDLSGEVTKKSLEEAMNGHVLLQTELVGLYRKVFE